MCVRLCDGYYWPVSFATLKESFGRDEQTCLGSCSSSTALYYYHNPGGHVEDMVSLQGMPYKSLPAPAMGGGGRGASQGLRRPTAGRGTWPAAKAP